jgi:hypothetical protein
MFQNDPLTSLAEEAMDKFIQALQPGRFLVEVLPWLRFIPEWCPGTGWKKTAREWRQLGDRMFNSGYEWALEQIVRSLEGTGLALTSLVSSETRQGNPFLYFGAPTTAGT